MSTYWTMQVKSRVHYPEYNGFKDVWNDVHCTGRVTPYQFATRDRAYSELNKCYPDQVRLHRISNEDGGVRVKQHTGVMTNEYKPIHTL